MGRWAPGAQGRLASAAVELYGEHGFENTTVAAIAERAGLTERTFFRHFADKREVLFSGSAELQSRLVGGVEAAPADRAPMEVIAAALLAVDGFFEDRRDHARRRQAVIDANAELQERELRKMASLAAALAAALRQRGVGELASNLAAEAGMAVFRVAFEAWVKGTDDRTLTDVIRAAMVELRHLTSGEAPAR